MANVGDVLLPILGGIAGTSPYLGSGIRTALTVDQALKRKKWTEAESKRKDDEKAATAEADRLQAEKERLFQKDLVSQIEVWGKENNDPHTVTALTLMARDDPGKAASKFYDLRDQKEEEARWTSERIGAVAGDLRRVNPEGSFGISGRLEDGGPFQMQYPAPSIPVAESLGPHKFGWKPVNSKTPWIQRGTDKDGYPTVFVDEVLKDAMAPYRTPEDDETESKIKAAELKVAKADAKLSKFIKGQDNARQPGDAPPDVRDRRGMRDLLERDSVFDDPEYTALNMELRQARAELTRLLESQSSETADGSENSTNGLVDTYDWEGNLIPRQ